MTYRYVSQALYRAGQIALLAEALIRGLTYLIYQGPAKGTQALFEAQHSAPVWVWGTLLVFFAACGYIGEILIAKTNGEHKEWMSYLAHTALMLLYGALFISGISALVDAGYHPFDYDYIKPADYLLIGFWHFIFARRRRSVAR